jgi:hypothetical protein
LRGIKAIEVSTPATRVFSTKLLPQKREEQMREWFERSDSMKGKDVSTKPYTMQMVFFDTIAIDEESKQ